jgi:hypothetical protein
VLRYLSFFLVLLYISNLVPVLAAEAYCDPSYNRQEDNFKLFRIHKGEVKSVKAFWGAHFAYKTLTPDEIQRLIEILNKVRNNDIKSYLGQPAPKGRPPRIILILNQAKVYP